MTKKYILLILLLFVSWTVPPVHYGIGVASGETIIYDSIVPESQYKVLILVDDLNYKYINELSYDVYVNNSLIGNYKKDEKIYIPDNSNVTINIIGDNINTNIGNMWDIGKTTFYIAVMYIVSGFLIIIIILFFVRKIWRK